MQIMAFKIQFCHLQQNPIPKSAKRNQAQDIMVANGVSVWNNKKKLIPVSHNWI